MLHLFFLSIIVLLFAPNSLINGTSNQKKPVLQQIVIEKDSSTTVFEDIGVPSGGRITRGDNLVTLRNPKDSSESTVIFNGPVHVGGHKNHPNKRPKDKKPRPKIPPKKKKNPQFNSAKRDVPTISREIVKKKTTTFEGPLVIEGDFDLDSIEQLKGVKVTKTVSESDESTWGTSKALIRKDGKEYFIEASKIPTGVKEDFGGVAVTNINNVLHFSYSGGDTFKPLPHPYDAEIIILDFTGCGSH